MTDSVFSTRYKSVLKRYLAEPNEKDLLAAADMGRELVAANVPVEDVGDLYEQALVLLTEEVPDQLPPVEILQRLSTPLLELLMAYGLAWRVHVDQLERKQVELRESEAHLAKLNQELEARVEMRTAALAAANKELDAFAYSVSHDLRAPLRAMEGFSQALLEDYEDKLDDEGKEYLAQVSAGSQRMAQLIDDLLQLSRVGRREIEPETVDISELVRTVAAELRQIEPERDVSFDIAPGVTGKGDARLLRIVFDNLLGNAWKFTSKNPQAKIEFGVTEQDGKPAYYLRDNGAGFDMTYADKLFQPFQRLHRAEEFEGTGIGLATVERVITRHGGRVWIDSAIEQGTTVYFALGREEQRR